MAAFVVVDLIIKLAVPVNSNDLWWHIVLGRQVLESGSLILDHSIYTWTPATANHTYNSWLSDVILYYIDETAGIAGLLILKYCVLFAIFLLAVTFAANRRLLGHPLTWVVILTGVSLGNTGFLIKPELFSMLFMTLVVWLYFTIRVIGDRAWRYAYLFPLLLMVWVNSHGAFFVSSIFFASTVVGEFFNAKFSQGQAMGERLRRHYFVAMLLCLPAILVNPYGIELPLNIIDLVINKGAEDYGYISAYQPTFILNKPPQYILEYLVLAMVVFVVLVWQKLKQRQTDWVVILSFVIYSALFTQMIRITYFLAPIFIFTSLDLLAARSGSLFWPQKSTTKHLITVLCVAIVTIMSLRVMVFGKVVLSDPVSWIERMQFVGNRFPQAESDFIDSHMLGRRIGNLYGDGGYLMYRHWPQKQVMIDPRYFPFKAWIDDYMKFSVEGQWIGEFVGSMDADYWLINYDKTKPLEWFAQSDQWSVAFFGPVGAIFVPTNEFKGRTIYSAQITSLNYINHLSKVLTAAVILGDVVLAKEIRKIAEKNIADDYKYKQQYLENVESFINGLLALSNQDLEKAAGFFTNARSFSYGLDFSAKLYRYLASLAWQEGDYLKARQWSIAAYDVHSDKYIPDIYNLALTDWHARHLKKTDYEIGNNKDNWEIYVDILLDKRHMIPENQQSIVDTAMKIKQGQYKGDAQLYQQSVFEKNRAGLYETSKNIRDH